MTALSLLLLRDGGSHELAQSRPGRQQSGRQFNRPGGHVRETQESADGERDRLAALLQAPAAGSKRRITRPFREIPSLLPSGLLPSASASHRIHRWVPFTYWTDRGLSRLSSASERRPAWQSIVTAWPPSTARSESRARQLTRGCGMRGSGSRCCHADVWPPYRRSGIAPCPEGLVFVFVDIMTQNAGALQEGACARPGSNQRNPPEGPFSSWPLPDGRLCCWA